MITDKKLTEWIFYRSIYYRPGVMSNKSLYDDLKYRELMLPHYLHFQDQLLECSLQEFVETMVWLFRERYPLNFRRIRTSQIAGSAESTDHSKNRRKAQDIYPLEFITDEDFRDMLYSVKIRFKEPQPNINEWVDNALEGKAVNKTTLNDETTYVVSDSPIIDTITVTHNQVFIKVDKNIFNNMDLK